MKALELIRKGWTQGPYARDQNGDPCGVGSNRAVKFCVLGALNRAYDGNWRHHWPVLKEAFGTLDLDLWNDASERTHAEVIAAFEKAGI